MGKGPARDIVLLSPRQLGDAAFTSAIAPDALPIYQAIAAWITSYLMRSHPDLGRSGEVCPFTARAHRLDTIRIGVSFAASGDVADVRETMTDCLRQFSSIACEEATKLFRTVIVAFPN